jgi:hypothetical protein
MCVCSALAADCAWRIADAVTHARFMGAADAHTDELVLTNILQVQCYAQFAHEYAQVLRRLLTSPLGALLSNECVCEVMQASFRICFETRLSHLLRHNAQCALTDMVHTLFSRLSTFTVCV